MTDRVILVVLDSVGIGELPDAKKYGDVGSNTLGNISKKLGGLNLPNLEKLGLGNIDGITEIKKVDSPIGAYGRSAELSDGKDTTTGHWEIAGIIVENAFPSYPEGFPDDIIKEFESKTGRKVIGNKPSSGTEILVELGEEHMKTGNVIVYTSADSVFQIAAHEEIVPIDELYKMCEIAREMLVGEHAVGRVIARPFIGEPGNFTRTSNRHDYSLNPYHETMLDKIKDKGYEVKAVGKIIDIYNGVGITDSVHTKSNMDGVDKTLEYMKGDSKGLIFTNLVDFDMKYGHRNDPEGYGRALEEFDVRLPEIIENMKDSDVLIITADHGCDPTTKGSDHSREYIPLLVYGNTIKEGVNIGTRETFTDIGQTVLDLLNIDKMKNGTSFKDMLMK